jgi:hypothetical protein
MSGSDEHGVCTRVCFVLGMNTMEPQKCCVYLFEGSGQDTTLEWLSKFKSGMNSTENAICSGQPSTKQKDYNVDRVKECFHKKRRLTLHEVDSNCEFHLVSPEHFDGQSGYVSECHQICTVPIK